MNGGRVKESSGQGPSLLAPKRLILFGVSVGFGMLPIVLYAAVTARVVRVLGVGLAFAAAAFLTGAFFGFLFGMPRARTNEAPAVNSGGPGYAGNTNLEQISDWLTKILVGAGLTQLANIPEAASRLFNAMATALGNREDSAGFAGGVTIYFTLVGFLLAWLATRLFLGAELNEADQRAQRLFAAAAAAEREGLTDEATRLRGQARTVLEEAAPA